MTRTAVVTGASSGIGAATVRRLVRDGWSVVGVARRADRLRALADETGAHVIAADLTVQHDVDALRDELSARGEIHALVNNAGGAIGKESVEEAAADDWRRMFEINVLATQRVTAALLPLLRRGITGGADHADDAGRGGADDTRPRAASIVTITSTAGHGVYEGGGGYNAAKFGERALSEVLRLELAGEPIRVIEIAPGMVRTDEFALVRFRGDAARAAAVYDDVPEPLTAADVADCVAFTLNAPPHVNVDAMTIRPVAQAANHKVAKGPLRIAR